MEPGTGMTKCVSLRPLTQSEDAVLSFQQLMKTKTYNQLYTSQRKITQEKLGPKSRPQWGG